MFGLVDRVYARCKNRLVESVLPPFVAGSGAAVWYCFLPEFVVKNRRLLGSYLPAAECHVFPVAAQFHMRADPVESLRRLDKTFFQAVDGLVSDRPVHVMGISLGCPLVTRFAARVNLQELVLVVPGDRLGPCAWESALTGQWVRGSVSKEVYTHALQVYDPVEYVVGLPSVPTNIFLGGYDLFIPAARGDILASRLQEHNPLTTVKKWWFADHATTLFLAAAVFKKSKDKSS
ncbi:MAG TPA: hypothetical protein VJB87_03185 [Candidatus Nanoarchaeia archaeon]|nr:hypothetical protein [Candidatus Nanoarchaeia archaeon]